MTLEQNFFLRLLRDYVHQATSEEPEQVIDWPEIIRFAVEQNLSGIIYCQAKRLQTIPPQAMQKLHEGFLADVYLSVNADHAYSQVVKQFEDASVEYMPFKGTLLRQYYPHPELRTMGDRDILIRHANRQASDEVMLSLGYEKYVDNHAVWTYYKKLLMFEIHDVMFYENLTNQVDYREYFSQVWENTKTAGDSTLSMEKSLDPGMHFLYSMAHTAKHVINKGMGFRAFLDMVFFAQNASFCGDEVDWEWIRTELEELRLLEFTKTCFSLCEAWFDVRMPFRLENTEPAFFGEITEKVFRDGIFGLHNQENVASNSAKEIRRSDRAYGITAIRLTMHKLFPSYEDMQLIPWYSWVDRKPWLMPAAWVYRWFYCMKNKRKASWNLLLEPYEKKETIEAREKYLERALFTNAYGYNIDREFVFKSCQKIHIDTTAVALLKIVYKHLILEDTPYCFQLPEGSALLGISKRMDYIQGILSRMFRLGRTELNC